MSVLDCFDCDETFPTPQQLETHVWKEHLSSQPDEEGACPTCTDPLDKSNATYHYPCFFDVDAAKLGLFHDTGSQLCPLCGRPQEDEEIESHLQDHSTTEWAGVLGDQRTCDVCEDVVRDAGDHLYCIRAASVSDTGDASDSETCPSEGCDATFENTGLLLWHIWDTHLDAQGQKRTCSGCDETIGIGDLRNHLPCIDTFDRRVSRLLPSLDRTCFICDLEVYDSSVLHRHMYQKHLTRQGHCPSCGETLSEAENADIVEHVVCIARATGRTPMRSLDSMWPCPVCGETYSLRQSLSSHVEDTHLELLIGDSLCNECGNPLTSLSDHLDCLLETRVTSRRGEGVRLVPNDGVDEKQYFDELHEFVDRERAVERESNRQRYEDSSIEHLAREQEAIPELVYIGEQSHPHFDTQLVFERPLGEKESEKNSENLVAKFGIYPREIILVGSEQHDSHLPQPGTVTFIDEQTIGIAFPELDGNLETPPLLNLTKDDRTYHVARLLNPATFDAEQEAIDEIRANQRLRDIVLGRTTLEGEALRLPDAATGQLNQYQVRAVERALGSEDVLCIHGPPGTGKTRTLTHLIRLAVARGQRVLAASHSNQAIDNLLVGTSTRVTPDPSSLHYVGSPAGRDRVLPPELEEAVEEGDENDKERAIQYLNRPNELSIARVGFNTENSVVNQEYTACSPREADVVAGTMGSLGITDTDFGEFDIVVIDEAGQAAQPPTFIPASYAGTLVLAGDHLQLPPFAADEEAKEEQMHISLFEHLLNVYGPDVSELLRRQYRMNEQIAAFPNEHIYNGRIETDEGNKDWRVDGLVPIMAVDIAGEEETPPGSTSKRNPQEAEMVADHVKLLVNSGLSPDEIGVITPYTAQISEINSAIYSKCGKLSGLKVATVDSFQGSEREAIVVSWVRSNRQNRSGFLSFPEEGKRRLNVAMTRPRKRLVLIGDWNTLGSVGPSEDRENTCSHLFAALYQWLNEQNLIKRISGSEYLDQ